MSKEKLIEYDGANFLNTEDDINEYLNIAFQSGDFQLIAIALGNVAKTKNLSKTARQIGMNRSGLHRSFSKNGNPKLSTFFKVANSLGIKLTAAIDKNSGVV